MTGNEKELGTQILITQDKSNLLKKNRKNLLPDIKKKPNYAVPKHEPCHTVLPSSNFKTSLPPIKKLIDQCELKDRKIDKKKKRKLGPATYRKTPPPVDGRMHKRIQTDMYLEELLGDTQQSHVITQTDLFLDRPPTPYFVPSKIGIDHETQIYEGDLFDFDIEAKPIIEVLVGKLIEQSLLEVEEEEELNNLREQQRIFEELRNAELEQYQKLEEQERRLYEEKMARLLQELSRQNEIKKLEKKIAAVAYSKGYINNLVMETIEDMRNDNYFYDDIEKDIDKNLMTVLTEDVKFNINKNLLSKKILDMIIREVLQKRFNDRKIKHGEEDTEDLHEPPKDNLRKSFKAESYNPIELEIAKLLSPKTKSVNEVGKAIQQMRDIFFMKQMPEEHLNALAQGLSERIVKANESIFKEGDIGDEFFIINEGKYEIKSNGKKINLFENEGHFGEMALLHNIPRRISVTAVTDGILWFLKRSNFKQIVSTAEHNSTKDYIGMVKRVKLFRNMTEKEFRKTADALKLQSFKSGDIVVKQGDEGNSLMIMNSGKAKLITATDKGVSFNYIDKGHYFGELALTDDLLIRSSTVEAVGDITVLVLERETFERMVISSGDLKERNKIKDEELIQKDKKSIIKGIERGG